MKDCNQDFIYKKIETTMRKGEEMKERGKKEVESSLHHLFIGLALITVATGPMSEAYADRAGLVQTHAYAVLNVVHIKVSARFCVIQLHVITSEIMGTDLIYSMCNMH